MLNQCSFYSSMTRKLPHIAHDGAIFQLGNPVQVSIYVNITIHCFSEQKERTANLMPAVEFWAWLYLWDENCMAENNCLPLETHTIKRSVVNVIDLFELPLSCTWFLHTPQQNQLQYKIPLTFNLLIILYFNICQAELISYWLTRSSNSHAWSCHPWESL